MRIATMILALILMLIVGLQSCAVSVGDEVIGEKTSQQGGPLGLFMALLFLIGGAFALSFPLVSLVAFVLAGLVGLSGGATTSFGDLQRLAAVLNHRGHHEYMKIYSEDLRRR